MYRYTINLGPDLLWSEEFSHLRDAAKELELRLIQLKGFESHRPDNPSHPVKCLTCMAEWPCMFYRMESVYLDCIGWLDTFGTLDRDVNELPWDWDHEGVKLSIERS